MTNTKVTDLSSSQNRVNITTSSRQKPKETDAASAGDFRKLFAARQAKSLTLSEDISSDRSDSSDSSAAVSRDGNLLKRTETPETNASLRPDSSGDQSETIHDAKDASVKTTKDADLSKKPDDDRLTDSVKKVLKDDLHVSDEELEEAMAESGLTVSDLSDPKKLLLLIAQLTGTNDSVGMLLNADASQTIVDLRSLFAESNVTAESSAVSQSGDSAAEELTSLGKGSDAPEPINLPETDEAVTASPSEVSGNTEFSDQVTDAGKAAAEANPSEQTADILSENSVENSRTTETAGNQKSSGTGEALTDPEQPVSADGQETGTLMEDALKKTEDGKDSSFENSSKNPSENEAKGTLLSDASGLTNQETTPLEGTETTFATEHTDIPDVRDLIDQIVSHARTEIREESQTMEMTLNPKQLGKLLMRVTEENGVIRARIQTENQDVRDALETRMILLQERFEEKGIRVDSIEISVSAHGFEETEPENSQNGENGFQNSSNGQTGEETPEQPSRRNINMDRLDDLKGLMSAEERLVAAMMRDQGGTVNYSA